MAHTADLIADFTELEMRRMQKLYNYEKILIICLTMYAFIIVLFEKEESISLTKTFVCIFNFVPVHKQSSLLYVKYSLL